MVIEGAGKPDGSVVVSEPIREMPRASKEEIQKAVRNDGVGLRGWMAEEAAWILAQLAKTAVSVAIFRTVRQLFRAGFASERVYRASADLWTHGHQEPTGSSANGVGPDWSRTASGPFNEQPRKYSSPGNGGEHAASERPRYVTSIAGRHLYLHSRRLNPEQAWPCPILAATPCRTCEFLEYDSGGTAQCTLIWKLKAVLHGIDAGETLDDVRDWINRS